MDKNDWNPTAPTPQSVAPPSVACSEWVDALAKRWERRVEELERCAKLLDVDEPPVVRRLKECIAELRAESESASTHRI